MATCRLAAMMLTAMLALVAITQARTAQLNADSTHFMAQSVGQSGERPGALVRQSHSVRVTDESGQAPVNRRQLADLTTTSLSTFTNFWSGSSWWWLKRFPPPPPASKPTPPPPAWWNTPKPSPPPPAWWNTPKPSPPPPAWWNTPKPSPPPPSVRMPPPPPPVRMPPPPPPPVRMPPPPPPPVRLPPPPPPPVRMPPPPPPPVRLPPPPPPPAWFTPKANPPPSPPPPSPPPPSPPPPPPPAVVSTPAPPPPAATPVPPGVVPPSPYSTPESVCVTPTSGPITVGEFPSSAFPVFPFTRPFKDPVKAQKATSTCHMNGQCIDGYQIDIKEVDLDLGVGCPSGIPTRVLTYNGTIPGPLFEVPSGKQTLVRFNNKIPANSVAYPPFEPCSTPTARGPRPMGRPISVHLHGMASLAPYDGFASDETCSGESKDYFYPNNRPNTGWYHDHALDITAENAHAGLAGMYLVKQQSSLGTEPDRWGLDSMEDHALQLADKVFDAKCQMVLDINGAHDKNHYGDVNMVNGIPFPVMPVQPKWIRFRILNSALARPWLLTLRDDQGKEVLSTGMCHVIAGDGGYRRTPIPFPAGGLYIGVAERYEIVSDFSQVKGRTLILWNHQDTNRMKDVPFFCYSHLVAQIVVAADCAADCQAAPKFQLPATNIPTHIDKVFSNEEYATAAAFAESGGCTRTFKFERRNGMWVINGENWHTVRVAASDVGSNAWEVWCLETGGGWFHPIHIHLIDFYVMKRYPQGDYQTLEPFESEVPKDVVVLHPGAKVAGLARWGPHRGEYMFHCHNLRHEDHAMMRTFVANSPIKNTVDQSAVTQALNKFTFSNIMGRVYDQYANPLVAAAAARVSAATPALTPGHLNNMLGMELYRLFYPGFLDDRNTLCNNVTNPWLVKPCKVFGR